MWNYTHISEWERRQIYTLLREWKLQKYIAEKLWRSPPSISREIDRWTLDWQYQPIYAQREYERRRSEINKGRNKLKNNPEMLAEIREQMSNKEKKRSPDSIAWRKKKNGEKFVCTTTIYKYIDDREPSLKVHLKYKKWYKKKWKIDNRGKQKENYKSIEERPEIVDARERIGDVEIDTIHSSGSERKWWMVTIVDRRTKFLSWWKVRSRTAREVANVLIREMKLFPKEKLFTITADNGKEFYDFERVESKLKVPMYFAHPYASWERGTNEQTNGMLRVFFPKWTDFSKISEEEIQEAIRIINLKPRKSLSYLCAYEVFYGVKLNL